MTHYHSTLGRQQKQQPLREDRLMVGTRNHHDQCRQNRTFMQSKDNLLHHAIIRPSRLRFWHHFDDTGSISTGTRETTWFDKRQHGSMNMVSSWRHKTGLLYLTAWPTGGVGQLCSLCIQPDRPPQCGTTLHVFGHTVYAAAGRNRCDGKTLPVRDLPLQ